LLYNDRVLYLKIYIPLVKLRNPPALQVVMSWWLCRKTMADY